MQIFKLAVVWCTAPAIAALLDLLTLKTVAFAVICFVCARVLVAIAEWFAVVAQRLNHGHVAAFLVLCSFLHTVLSIAAMVIAQANYFLHWVA